MGLVSRVCDTEDTTGFLLDDMYKALPHPVHNLVHTELPSQRTYDELSADVLVLHTSDLKDGATAYTHDEEMAHLTHEPMSHTKALWETLLSTHIQLQHVVRV